jgi:predicted negative regulator of RcsB-dependent stress response
MAVDLNNDKEINDKFYELFLKHKKKITFFALIFLGLYFISISIKNNKEQSLLIASDMYQKVQISKNINEIEIIVNELKKDYKNTAYASRASSILGNLYIKEKKYDAAKESFLWSIENAIEPSIKSLAHYQLALNLYLQQDYDSALQEALSIDEQGFRGLKFYILGDIFLKLNKKNDAIDNFKKALNFYQNKNDLAKVIKTKLDAIAQN